MLSLRLIIVAFSLLLAYPAAAENIRVPLGSKKVTLSVSGSGSGPTCVALHSNETTAIGAVKGLCGKLIILRNGGARDVTFTLDGVNYRFDPNRIFTAAGRQATITPKATSRALQAVSALTTAITREFGGSPLVGLHNNTNNGNLSIHSFGNAKIFPNQDPDNFVLTTNRGYYSKAVALGYNAVMDRGKDDGSLSVYARRAGRPYLNVEAEAASGSWQRQAYQKLLR